MNTKSANQFMVTSPAQVHDFHEDISTEFKLLFFKSNKYAISSQPLNDILFRVLIYERVVMSIVYLSLKAECVFDLREILNDQVLQLNSSWCCYEALEDLLEIKNIANLRRLSDTLSVPESLPTIVGYCILCAISQSTIHQVAAYKGACSTFPGIAMNIDNIFRIGLKELMDCVASFGQQYHCWAMMIFPRKVRDLVLKWSFIILSTTAIEYPEIFTMIFLDVCSHIVYVVSVPLLEIICSWEAHGIYSWCDWRQI